MRCLQCSTINQIRNYRTRTIEYSNNLFSLFLGHFLSKVFFLLIFPSIPASAEIGNDCRLSMPFQEERAKKHAKIINNWTLSSTISPWKSKTHCRQHNALHRVISFFLIKTSRAISPRKFLQSFFFLHYSIMSNGWKWVFFCLLETVCAYAHIAGEFSLLFTMFYALLLRILETTSPEKKKFFLFFSKWIHALVSSWASWKHFKLRGGRRRTSGCTKIVARENWERISDAPQPQLQREAFSHVFFLPVKLDSCEILVRNSSASVTCRLLIFVYLLCCRFMGYLDTLSMCSQGIWLTICCIFYG